MYATGRGVSREIVPNRAPNGADGQVDDHVDNSVE